MNRILLTILPYWSPVIPPVGLSVLKGYLEPRGNRVRIVDLNVKTESLKFYYDYFQVLMSIVPEERRGTFFNLGNEILRTNLMVHLYCKDEIKYIEIVQTIINKWFFVQADKKFVLQLKGVIDIYLNILEAYTKYLMDYLSPHFVGATVYKTNMPLTLYFFQLVKKYSPTTKTIIGGGAFADSHALGSDNFKRLLEITQQYIDKIVIGQGEKTFFDYINGDLNDSERYYISSIKNQEKWEIDNTKYNIDFTDFNMRKYSHLAFISAFSCPFKCSFCNEYKFWGNYRKRPNETVINEMKELYATHNRQLFFATDSLLNYTVDAISEEVYRQNLPFYYDTYFRVSNDTMKLENTIKWRNGGLYRVRLGLESGSQKMLDLMNKQITVPQIKESLKAFSYAGIKTTTYWVIGHPGETEEDFQMTLDLIEECKDYIWQAECNLFQYFRSGTQNSEDEWSKASKLMYPEEYTKYLIFEEWELEKEPLRDLAFDRICRFITHCKSLGIPNPYSAYENFEADKRWSKLTKNAVPFTSDLSKENESPIISRISQGIASENLFGNDDILLI